MTTRPQRTSVLGDGGLHQPNYQTNLVIIQQRDEALQQNYGVLTQERENIGKMVREYETLNSAQENGDINTTMNYYNYIILVFIVLLLIFLLLRFSIPSEQSGGSGLHKFVKKITLCCTTY